MRTSYEVIDLGQLTSDYLGLLCAQVEAALKDLEKPQSNLVGFFDKVVTEIDSATERAPKDSKANNDHRDEKLKQLRSAANKSIVEFQAFDRVEQRLRNVQKVLCLLSDESVSAGDQLELVANLQVDQTIKASYCLEHERTLHKLMQEGSSRAELLSFCQVDSSETIESGIELF